MVWPDGNAAIAVASLEPKTGALRRMGAPITAASKLHSFVVLSAGFQAEGPPANVVVFSGSLQMQLAPNPMHRCSSAWALVVQRSDKAASTMAWVSRWVVIVRSNIGASLPVAFYSLWSGSRSLCCGRVLSVDSVRV